MPITLSVIVFHAGGIVNVEVRRQAGSSGSDPSGGGSFSSSRDSSPQNVVFARTPPLPMDTRFRGGFGGIALHGTDTGSTTLSQRATCQLERNRIG